LQNFGAGKTTLDHHDFSEQIKSKGAFTVFFKISILACLKRGSVSILLNTRVALLSWQCLISGGTLTKDGWTQSVQSSDSIWKEQFSGECICCHLLFRSITKSSQCKTENCVPLHTHANIVVSAAKLLLAIFRGGGTGGFQFPMGLHHIGVNSISSLFQLLSPLDFFSPVAHFNTDGKI
jgi:hypothetical protein